MIEYVDQQVVNTLTPSLWDLKTELLRSAALRSVELICKALLTKHPGKQVWSLITQLQLRNSYVCARRC